MRGQKKDPASMRCTRQDRPGSRPAHAMRGWMPAPGSRWWTAMTRLRRTCWKHFWQVQAHRRGAGALQLLPRDRGRRTAPAAGKRAFYRETRCSGWKPSGTPSAHRGSTSSPARRTGCTPAGCLRMPATRWACCMRLLPAARPYRGLHKDLACPIRATMSCAMQAASRTVPDTRCVWR